MSNISSYFSPLSVSNTPEITTLRICNGHSSPVTVWLTLGSQQGQPPIVTSLKEIAKASGFSIKQPFPDNPSVGTFELPGFKGQDPVFFEYAPQAAYGFNGNIAFDFEPSACPPAGAKNGVNTFEFMLNTQATTVVPFPDETINISCVDGVNSLMQIFMQGPGTWSYPGGAPITSILNQPIGNNNGIPGVYPTGCNTCTGIASQPCPGTILELDKPNTKLICNLDRVPASQTQRFGGYVTVILLGFTS